MNKVKDINFFGNGVIVCTQQAFPTIPFIECQNEWGLIVDEIPKIDKFYDPSLPYTNKILSEYLNISEVIGTSLYKVITSKAGKKCKNVDSMLSTIKPILEDVYSDNYLTYTLKKNWDNIVDKNKITSDESVNMKYGNDENKLYFLSLLQPSIYNGFSFVMMMGANFTNSLLYKYWSEYCHINFIEFAEIKSKLRYEEYSNGSRLTIFYLQEEHWSKDSGSKFISGKPRLQHYAVIVERKMGNDKFLYVTNNDDQTTFVNGIKIPVISHGLNTFQDIHNVYFSAALNNQPQHTSMLESLGIPKNFIIRSNFHEVLHQGVMRSSLRNPNATESVNVIVPDMKSAEFLASLFKGCSIGPIDGCLKKVVALTQVVRNKRARLRETLQPYDLCSLVDLPINALNLQDCNILQDDAREKMITNPYNVIDICNQNFSINFTSLTNIYDKTTNSGATDAMEFIHIMKTCFTNHAIREKDEIGLFNCVKYLSNHSRKLDNVEYASLVIVDIDNGDLSPTKFFKIFTENHKHSFIMCNSFSCSKEKPNNYRAIFFLNRPVDDYEYRLVQQYIQGILDNNGYISCVANKKDAHLKKNPNVKFSGIDLSKIHSASFFYVPCKVIGREDDAFFKRGNCKDIKQLNHYAIDVNHVLQYSLIKEEFPKLVCENEHNTNFNLQDIKNHMLQADLQHLGQHESYGQMAAAMHNSGFTLNDFIEVTPFISRSKTKKDAKVAWESWGKYQKIQLGTLLYLIKYKNVA